MALKISEPAVSARTPGGLTRLTSAAKFSSYSPCEPILDNTVEEEQFLVQLTPEKSPSKEKSAASPKLENKKELVEVEKRINSVGGHIVDTEGHEEIKAAEILVEVNGKKVNQPVDDSESKKNVTPIRKVSKENVKPRVVLITEYMSSGSLKQFLRKIKKSEKNSRKIPLQSWRRWCTQILSALKYLHSFKVSPVDCLGRKLIFLSRNQSSTVI